MSKKFLVVALVLGVMTTSVALPAEAAPKKKKPKKVERVVEFEYMCPCVGLFQLGGLTGSNIGGGPMSVGAESYLTAEAVDITGQPVPVDINQDTDGDGDNDDVGSFCTTTEAPMPINPGLEIRVFVGFPTTCGAPSALAGGTITFTLSNLP
ncbi:MAG: hypothetical protein M3161_00515 [Actinomycetota bacterium]|nr:hypothetical protein [Actinomycetota bacterium]